MHPNRSINSHQDSPHSRQQARFGQPLLGQAKFGQASLGLGLVGALFFALGLFSCELTRLSDGMPDNAERCTSCHGTPGNPAPPQALNGSWDTNHIAVGAHQKHLIANDISGGVPCYECHPIPTELLTHPNWSGQPTAVVFGPRATLNQPTPAPAAAAWDRASGTCSNVYCHGATLSGLATRSAPFWTKVDGSQRRCTSCHGFPPPGTAELPHPTDTNCASCHGVVAGPGQSIVNPARHADGVIDIGGPTSAAAGHAPSAGAEVGVAAW
jgi:predicted CxxxxCH...CXXCH cytochrome family protein